MQNLKVISPTSSFSSVSCNSVDFKSLNDSDDNFKMKRDSKVAATPIVVLPAIKSKYPYIVEKDGNYKNGKKLLVRGKDLKQLNENMFKASSNNMSLTSLELSPDCQSCLDYRLERLPKNINLFKNLRELKLDTNELSELPTQIGELSQLERLSLSNNNLKSLPEQTFSKLIKLRSLHLANNELEAIPSSLFSLRSLEFLDLTSNFIKKIDKNIAKLQSCLKVLMIYDNQIEDLSNIHELKALDVFWFGDNKVKCLPLSITAVKTLDWKNKYLPLILDNNPITEPPIHVCKAGFEAIQTWYEKNNKDASSRMVNKNTGNK